MVSRKRRMRASGSARFTANTVTRCDSSAARRRSKLGISSRHGSHQVAQKFTSTARPRESARRFVFPWRSDSSSGGVGPPVHGLSSSAYAGSANAVSTISKSFGKRRSLLQKKARPEPGSFRRGQSYFLGSVFVSVLASALTSDLALAFALSDFTSADFLVALAFFSPLAAFFSALVVVSPLASVLVSDFGACA